jgi:type IV pilus assembly protein PilN
MIKINLLGEEIDRSGLYLLQFIGFLGALALAIGACYAFQSGRSSHLAELESRKSQLEIKLARLKKETKEAEELEEKKQFLKDKLTTIATLKANKYGPVRMMDDINGAIPERAWLKEITEKNKELELKGVALDNQTVSSFMVDLENSPFFKNVDLGESVEIVKDDVKLRNFVIKASVVSSLDHDKNKEKEEDKKES